MGEDNDIFILCSVEGDLKYINLPSTSGEFTSSCGWKTGGKLQILRQVKDGQVDFVVQCKVKGTTNLLPEFSLSGNIGKISRIPTNPSRCTIQLKEPKTGSVSINKAKPTDVQLLIEVLEEIKRTLQFCDIPSTQQNPDNNFVENTTPTSQSITANMKQSSKKKAKAFAKTKNAPGLAQEKTQKKQREPLGDLKNISKPKPSNQLLYLRNEVIKKLWDAQGAALFKKPLEWCLKGTVQPMDLGTIRQRLETLYYTTVKDCIADLDLMFNNVRKFCQNGEVMSACFHLHQKYKKLLANMPPEEVESKLSTAADKGKPQLNSSSSGKQTQDDDDLIQLKYLFEVVEKLWNRALGCSSKSFHKPVDTKMHKDYLDIVKRPMDLGTIRGNLLRHRYSKASECIADINQVFTNCYLYNQPKAVEEARTLEKMFLTLKADMPERKGNVESPESDGCPSTSSVNTLSVQDENDTAKSSGIEQVKLKSTSKIKVQNGVKRKASATISCLMMPASSVHDSPPKVSKKDNKDYDSSDGPDSPLPVIDFGNSVQENENTTTSLQQPSTSTAFKSGSTTATRNLAVFNADNSKSYKSSTSQRTPKSSVKAVSGHHPSASDRSSSSVDNFIFTSQPSINGSSTDGNVNSSNATSAQRKSVPYTPSVSKNLSSTVTGDSTTSKPASAKRMHNSLNVSSASSSSSSHASLPIFDSQFSQPAKSQKRPHKSTITSTGNSSSSFGNSASFKPASAQRMSNHSSGNSTGNSWPGFTNSASKTASVQGKSNSSTVSSVTSSKSSGSSNAASFKPSSSKRMSYPSTCSSVGSAVNSATQPFGKVAAAKPSNQRAIPSTVNSFANSSIPTTSNSKHSAPNRRPAPPANTNRRSLPSKTTNINASAPANGQRNSFPSSIMPATSSVTPATSIANSSIVGNSISRQDMNNGSAPQQQTAHTSSLRTPAVTVTSSVNTNASTNIPQPPNRQHPEWNTFQQTQPGQLQQTNAPKSTANSNDSHDAPTTATTQAQSSLSLLESFREELSCAICTEELNEPKDLECSHTFCKMCLQEWLVSQTNRTSLPCPVCLKHTPVPDAGFSSLKTNRIIKNLADQVRSAVAGSPPRSQCKIHDDMVVKINCKTCEQLICEKCVDICKLLGHIVEDDCRRFGGNHQASSGQVIHPLSDKKRKYLVHLTENRKRSNVWNEQVHQIKDLVRQYGDQLKEKIDKDIELKMSDIQKLDKEGAAVFDAYEKEIKALLEEVDGAIHKQTETKKAAEVEQQRSVAPAINQTVNQAYQGAASLGPRLPFNPSYHAHQGLQGRHVPPALMQQRWHIPVQQTWQMPIGAGQLSGHGLVNGQSGQLPGGGGQQATGQPMLSWGPHPGWPGHVGPAQEWIGRNAYHGNGNHGNGNVGQNLWQQNPFFQPSTSQATSFGSVNAGHSGKQLQPGPAVARQPNHEIDARQRAVDYEIQKVLKKDLPCLPPHRSLKFVASGHHQQEFPIGQVVFQWW